MSIRSEIILFSSIIELRLKNYLAFAIPIAILSLLTTTPLSRSLCCIAWIYSQDSLIDSQWCWIEWLFWQNQQNALVRVFLYEHFFMAFLLSVLSGGDWLTWFFFYMNLLLLKTMADLLSSRHFSMLMMKALSYLISIPWLILFVSWTSHPQNEYWIFMGSACLLTLVFFYMGPALLKRMIYPFEWRVESRVAHKGPVGTKASSSLRE